MKIARRENVILRMISGMVIVDSALEGFIRRRRRRRGGGGFGEIIALAIRPELPGWNKGPPAPAVGRRFSDALSARMD
jgi:hypothetical protein